MAKIASDGYSYQPAKTLQERRWDMEPLAEISSDGHPTFMEIFQISNLFSSFCNWFCIFWDVNIPESASKFGEKLGYSYTDPCLGFRSQLPQDTNDRESKNCDYLLFSITRFFISRTPYPCFSPRKVAYLVIWTMIQVERVSWYQQANAIQNDRNDEKSQYKGSVSVTIKYWNSWL